MQLGILKRYVLILGTLVLNLLGIILQTLSPHQLSDYVDYYGFITNTFDEIEIEETKDNYIFLSEKDFEELYL